MGTSFNISGPEILLILFIISLCIAIGHYGRNTTLGHWGAALLSLFATPLIGFAVVYYLMESKNKL